jgi:tetratricopeptide (TPR) repeat protein
MDGKQEVKRLLRRGLHHYGLGELEAAIACWEKARALDPDNRPVQDYLAAAYDEADVTPRSLQQLTPSQLAPEPPTPAPETATGLTPRGPVLGEDDPDTLVASALDAFRRGRLRAAWAELNLISRAHPDRLDVRGYLELVRKDLIEDWAHQIGDRGRALVRVANDAQIMALDLKPDEAYLLSHIDGHVCIDDLISLSTVDRFRTFEILVRLLREGIVE